MKTLTRSSLLSMLCALVALGSSDTLSAQTNTLLVSSASLTFTSQTGGAAPGAQNLVVATSGASLGVNVSATTTSGGNWLSINTTHINTTGTITVSAAPGSLGAGTYNGSLTLTADGAANSPTTVPVTLTVATSSQLVATPASFSFFFQTGGSTPANQTLVISSNGSPLNFTVTGSALGGAWLLLAPLSGTTPGAITVGVNPSGLAPGNYPGSINVTAAGASNSPLSIPVALTVSNNPPLAVTPASLTFNFQMGGSSPLNQALTVSSGSVPLNFSAAASTSGGGSWLVGNFAGATPSVFNVGVNVAGLGPGTYTGAITISAASAANSPITVPVTLNVSGSALLSAGPGSLSFGFQTGGSTPASQTISLTSTGAALNFAVSSITSSGGSWLVAGPLSGSTPGSVIVAANPAGLSPGAYQGAITVAAVGGGGNSIVIPVTLTVTNNPILTASPASLSFGFQIGTAAPGNQTLTLSSTGAPFNFTAAASTSTGGPWLNVGSSSGTTPSTLTVSVNPSGLTAATYTGSITITAGSAGNSPLVIPVTLVVSNTALLVASPAVLNFAAPVGSSSIDIRTVSLTSTDSTALSFGVTATTNSGGGWLLVGPLVGTTPVNLNVTVNPTGLAAGTYTGSIVITAPPSVANSPQTVAVTLTITPSATLAVSPVSLAFTQAAGGTPPLAQTLAVSSTGGSVSFTASATTSTGGNWLAVTPQSGGTPNTLAVTVNAGTLAAGTYNGSVTIISSSVANSPQTIPVTLTVTTPQALVVAPAGLSFSFQIGGPVPAAQPIAVSAGGASLSFTAAAAVSSGGNWLSVTPTSGTTANTLLVSVNPSNLAAGTYNGTITITSAGASNSPQIVNVSLVVTAAAVVPSVGAVVNAASFLTTAVAPGQIITIFGTNIGPATPATLRVTAGLVDTTIGDTQVLFDGIAAPMVYASATQVSTIVPYQVFGRFSTRLQISFQGTLSAGVDLRVVDTAPGIFTIPAAGTGQGAILNQDLSINSSANPARKGSVVVIYMTGEGQTSPGGVTGQIIGSVLKQPLASVSVTIGGQSAEVLYKGSAPTLVSGVLQVNARVPDGIASGNAQVLVTIGGVLSQPGVTVAVQ